MISYGNTQLVNPWIGDLHALRGPGCHETVTKNSSPDREERNQPRDPHALHYLFRMALAVYHVWANGIQIMSHFSRKVITSTRFLWTFSCVMPCSWKLAWQYSCCWWRQCPRCQGKVLPYWIPALLCRWPLCLGFESKLPGGSSVAHRSGNFWNGVLAPMLSPWRAEFTLSIRLPCQCHDLNDRSQTGGRLVAIHNCEVFGYRLTSYAARGFVIDLQ